MHILVLPSWYPTSYAPMSGAFFRDQAQALTEAGHRVSVLCPDLRSLRTLGVGRLSYGYSRETDGSLTVHRYHGFSIPKLHRLNGRRWIARARDLYSAYVSEHGRPDLVHAHSALWAGVAAARMAGASGTPYVLTEHSSGFARGLFSSWEQPFLREAIGSAREVIAVSEALRDSLAG